LAEASVVQEFVAKARRRSLAHLALDQSALALTIGMGGVILLLLTGTQILDWYWVVLITVVSFGVGLYRLRKTIPTTYELAQRIDRRLSLADSLSTAIYFSSPDAPGLEAIRERQRAEAESIARRVDLRAGVPFTRPRFTYPALALAAVACGLFAVRYAVIHSLSLEPSLVQIALDTFFPPTQQVAKNKPPAKMLKAPLVGQQAPDAPTTEQDQQPEQTLDANEVPEASNPDATDNSKSAAKESKQDPSNETPGDKADKNDKSPNGNDSNQESNAPNDSKDGKQQQSSRQDSKQGNSNQNSSLMDKLKDAMSNMLNKMKSQPKDQQSQQNAQNNNQNQDKSGQKGQQSQDQKQQSSSADSQSEQSDAGDKNQSADAKGAEKSSDKDASKDSKSGIGSADGDKSAKEAEQEQAMGKISEIIGKRAQNVTGEVMVEVGSSKQQLKTPWAQKQATHAESGSEIHRDEVPLMYQQFVQQYFEEIRKTAPAKPATKE
jgi:hypothetical protein